MILEAVIFMLFTGDFLMEQLESVRDNQTCVESYQWKIGEKRPLEVGLVNVMGRNSYTWLLPVKPDFVVDWEEKVLVCKSPANEKDKEL